MQGKILCSARPFYSPNPFLYIDCSSWWEILQLHLIIALYLAPFPLSLCSWFILALKFCQHASHSSFNSLMTQLSSWENPPPDELVSVTPAWFLLNTDLLNSEQPHQHYLTAGIQLVLLISCSPASEMLFGAPNLTTSSFFYLVLCKLSGLYTSDPEWQLKYWVYVSVKCIKEKTKARVRDGDRLQSREVFWSLFWRGEARVYWQRR